MLAEGHNFDPKGNVGLPAPGAFLKCPEAGNDYDLVVVLIPLNERLEEIPDDESVAATQVAYGEFLRGQIYPESELGAP